MGGAGDDADYEGEETSGWVASTFPSTFEYLRSGDLALMRSVCVLETRDGKKHYDNGPRSKDMERLNKAFGRMHGISAMVNLVGVGITVWYGFLLAERLQ